MDWDRTRSMLEEARAELRTAEILVMHLRQVVSGLEGLLKASPISKPIVPQDAEAERTATAEGESNEESARDYPKASHAILTVLRERPNYPMLFDDIWREIEKRGLVDPSLASGRNAYTTAAHRLAKRAEHTHVRRDDRGRLIYEPPVAPHEVPRETPRGSYWEVQTS